MKKKDGAALRLHDHHQQVGLVDASLHDRRPSIPTGVEGIDALLRRRGLLPGTFVLLGGRTGTRKSTVVANMMVSMAQANTPVGLVGLDEQAWQYVVSLISVQTGKSRDWVENHWDDERGAAAQREWKALSSGMVSIFTGRRPTLDHLEAQVEMAGISGEPPQVLFVDYLTLMTRDSSYGYKDNDRIPRLAEDIAIWSTETGISVVALHQLSRNDEFGGTNNRNAGHLPVTLAQLKFGGEEPADIVMATYRPSMDPMALMAYDVAKLTLGDRFDEDEYYERKSIAKKYEQSTFLQLLKNRPGSHREERGVELLSPTESLRMFERDVDTAQDDDGRESALDEDAPSSVGGDPVEDRREVSRVRDRSRYGGGF